jgi:hypothetical protein
MVHYNRGGGHTHTHREREREQANNLKCMGGWGAMVLRSFVGVEDPLQLPLLLGREVIGESNVERDAHVGLGTI